jgi:ribosome-associated toxin RatA of RatAB toxin-antitoxin module
MKRLANALLGCLFGWGLAFAVPGAVRAEGPVHSDVVLGASLAPASSTAVGHVGAPAAGPIVLANVPGPNGGVEWGRAEGVIDAHPADVLAILHDYAQYAGLFPHFEKSRVLSQRGTDAIVYLEAKILHGAATLWGQVRMSSTASGSSDPAAASHVVEAKMMKGKSNIAQLLARWELTPVDDGRRTKVAFQLLVDPDLPVPDVVVSSEMKNSAGRAFRALRSRASQRAVYAARPNTAM